MNSPRYDEIVELLGQTNNPEEPSAIEAEAAAAGAETAPELLPDRAILLTGTATTMADAINEAGGLLLAQGAVEQPYIDSMHVRETSVSTAMGNGLAIPHGTNEAKTSVLRTALSFVRYDQPIDWNGKPVRFVVAIAGVGNEHLKLLAQLAVVFVDSEQVARLEAASTPEQVQQVLASAKG